MNLNDLYPIQAKLDKNIGESKGIDMEEYQEERVLALQVEFNELLNELPFLFKYWSNKRMNREKALEEFSDGLHFLLSIGNDYGITNHQYKAPKVHDMKLLARGINNMISRLNRDSYSELVNHYILFGEKLGFTESEIKEGYFAKNKVNYERQANGY